MPCTHITAELVVVVVVVVLQKGKKKIFHDQYIPGLYYDTVLGI